MNRFLVIVLVFLGAAAGLCVVDGPSEQGRASAADDDTWRRTNVGWQRNTNWFVTPRQDTPAPHPLTVALFQLLFSVFALMLLPARTRAAIREKQALAGPQRQHRRASRNALTRD